MSWKLSVGTKVSQPFDHYDFYSTLSSNEAVSSTSFSVSTTNQVEALKKDDIIRLGPSSNSANLGATEFIRVDNVTAALINTLDGLQYAYNSGDIITGLGSGLPNGWEITKGFPTAPDILTLGMNSMINATGHHASGLPIFHKSFGFDVTGGIDTGRIDIGVLEELHNNVYYNCDVWMFQDDATKGDGTVQMVLYKYSDHTTPLATRTGLETESSYWQKFSMGPFIGYRGASDFPLLSIEYIDPNSTVAVNGSRIGYIVLGHAGGTSNHASGYVTFSDNPNSITRTDVDRLKIQTGLLNETFKTYPLYPETKKIFKWTFDQVTTTFIKDLEMLTLWQEQGNFLWLELDSIDGEYNVPVPGYIDFNLFDSHWDLENFLSMNLIFRGI